MSPNVVKIKSLLINVLLIPNSIKLIDTLSPIDRYKTNPVFHIILNIITHFLHLEQHPTSINLTDVDATNIMASSAWKLAYVHKTRLNEQILLSTPTLDQHYST